MIFKYLSENVRINDTCKLSIKWENWITRFIFLDHSIIRTSKTVNITIKCFDTT